MPARFQGKPARSGTARYDILRDPTDRFIVWDESADRPALLEGEIVSCDTFPAAQRAVERLSSARPSVARAEVRLRRPATAPSSSRQ